MAHSTLLGTDKVPRRPKGTDEEALGPSDGTDSGSDLVGTDSLPAADPGEPVDVTLNRDQAVAPIEGTSEDSHETEATDIGTDRVIESLDAEEQVLDEEDSVDTVPPPPRRGLPSKPS